MGIVTAEDVDLPDDTLTFVLTGDGPDDTLFSIAPDGNLSLIAPPDFENPIDVGGIAGDNTYLVEVRVTDEADEAVMATMTVNVSAINDNAPVFTSGVNRYACLLGHTHGHTKKLAAPHTKTGTTASLEFPANGLWR